MWGFRVLLCHLIWNASVSLTHTTKLIKASNLSHVQTVPSCRFSISWPSHTTQSTSTHSPQFMMATSYVKFRKWHKKWHLTRNEFKTSTEWDEEYNLKKPEWTFFPQSVSVMYSVFCKVRTTRCCSKNTSKQTPSFQQLFLANRHSAWWRGQITWTWNRKRWLPTWQTNSMKGQKRNGFERMEIGTIGREPPSLGYPGTI